MHGQRTLRAGSGRLEQGARPSSETLELLQAFERYLARHGRATGTRGRYGRVLVGFGAWLGERPPAALSAEQIDGFLERWQERFLERYGRAPALASQRGQVNALRAFYGYLDRFSLLSDSEGRP